MERIYSLYHLSRKVAENFIANRCTIMASALAYSTLLSLVPLIIIIVTILAHFPLFSGADDVLQSFVMDNFVASSADQVVQQIHIFLEQVKNLRWVNYVALLFVSILLLYNMVHSFNLVWHVKLRHHWAISFLIYLLILLLAPITFGLLLMISSYIASLPIFMQEHASVFLKKPFLILIPYVSAFFTFSFFNWAIPSCRVRFKHALIAGFITTLLYESAKYLFVFYLHYFSAYQIIYGALATIPIFLLWIYLSWLIILLGVQICYQLHQFHSE